MCCRIFLALCDLRRRAKGRLLGYHRKTVHIYVTGTPAKADKYVAHLPGEGEKMFARGGGGAFEPPEGGGSGLEKGLKCQDRS